MNQFMTLRLASFLTNDTGQFHLMDKEWGVHCGFDRLKKTKQP